MNKYLDEHRLRIDLHGATAPSTVSGVAQRARRVLDLLRKLHAPLVQDLKVYDGMEGQQAPALLPDFSNLSEQLRALVARQWRDAYPKLEFHTDEAGRLGQDQALAKSGGLSVGRIVSMLAPEFFSAMFNAVPSAHDLPGGAWEVRLKLPRGPEPEFRDGAFLRQLFKQLIEIHPDTECAAISNVAIDRDTTCYGGYGVNLGWLTYVAEPELAAHLPDGVKWERFAAGVLIDLQDEPPFADAPALAAQAVRVRDMLAPGGWLMVKRLRGLGHALPYRIYDPSYGGTPPG